MIPPLPPELLRAPIAHRALHDKSAGRPENSIAAIQAAVDAGYGIEIDVQRTSDGVAMVFHDYALERLTGRKGTVQTTTADALQAIPLLGGIAGPPRLSEVLALVAGRNPVLIEIKDQDGMLGPNVGRLEKAIAHDLEGYVGPVAIMSFNPHSVAAMAALLPNLPRGIVTCAYTIDDWPIIPVARRDELRDVPDFDRVGASFISHDEKDLAAASVARFKARGVPVLCWTIKSPEAEARARQIVDNVTFEGYRAELPA